MHRNLLHSYTLAISEREINNPIFYCNKKKYSRINLPKEAKNLYKENYQYKILMKEIKDHTNRCRDIPCSWIERANTVKMMRLSKAIYKLNVIPMKLSMAFFTELEQKIL